jgi:hypothetical protein
MSEPEKSEEIVHPRTDFRDTMKAAGATDAEIEALMLAHVRMDGWAMLGFSWVMLIGFPLVNRIITDHPGLSDQQQIALSMGGLMAPMFAFIFLINRSVRAWISIYESRFEAMIVPNIRYRASENTYEEYAYAWFILVAIQMFAFIPMKTLSYSMIIGVATFNAAIILGTIYRKTGSICISAPVRWGDEIIYPHQVKATAGSVVGQFQSQLTFYTWEEIKNERALTRKDHAALYARREGRRPK